MIYCLYLIGAKTVSADSPPLNRIDLRKIFVIDCLQGESVSGSVG